MEGDATKEQVIVTGIWASASLWAFILNYLGVMSLKWMLIVWTSIFWIPVGVVVVLGLMYPLILIIELVTRERI